MVVSFGMERFRGAGHSREACPRESGERESSPSTEHSRRPAKWIPAFARMTAAWGGHAWQMTPVPRALNLALEITLR